jgi:hypothetical protein
MPDAWNAAVAYLNLADDGIVTATTSASLAPPSVLQNQHVARKWRSVGNNEAIVIDLGSQQSIDTVALMGVNLSATGTTRLRISTADTSGQDGSAYNGTSVAGRVDPSYGRLIFPVPSPVTGRYVRVDLADASLSYIEAGRVFVGRRHQFPVNFSFGWNRGWRDRSRRVQSRGGQTYVERDNSYLTLEVSFEWVPKSDRYGFVEELDRLNGMHEDVLLILDPSSSNLGRDSIWGLVDEIGTVTQPQVWLGDEEVYTKSYRISERL